MYGWLPEVCDASSPVVTASRRLARQLLAEYSARKLAAGERAYDDLLEEQRSEQLVQRQIGRDMAIELSYIYKKTKNFLVLDAYDTAEGQLFLGTVLAIYFVARFVDLSVNGGLGAALGHAHAQVVDQELDRLRQHGLFADQPVDGHHRQAREPSCRARKGARILAERR